MQTVRRCRLVAYVRVGIGALLLCAPTLALSQPTGRALAIEDYYTVKTVGPPELSPDGRWVAFTVTTRIEQTNGSTSEVWLVGTDGASPAQLVSPPGVGVASPSWEPDGRLTFRAGERVWVLDPSTPSKTGIMQIHEGRVRTPDVPGPNGKWIARVREIPQPQRDPVYASDFEKRHEQRFKGVQFDWLNFQRDGASFPIPNSRDPEVSPPQEIFIRPASETAERQLTTLGLRPAGMHWNRDGRTLMFTADSGYRNELSYGRTDIWSVDLDGRVARLTPERDYSYAGARYSPDGKYILATRDYPTDRIIAQRLDHGGPTDLVIIPAGGGRETVLTADWDYLPTAPRWSPDSRHVYFTGGIGGTTHLFRVPVSGGAVQQITTGERRIGGLAIDSAFRRIAFTVGRFEAPSEIHVANIDGTNERQLTHVGDPFVKEVALGRSDRLQFRSADGTQVEGWLLYPYGYRADGGPYPLIVSNHGGPHSAVGYGFDFKSQYFAANGYFVLQVNFRSSTGYGEKFLWGTWGAWGTKDGQDVIAGIDHAMTRVPIDPRRVATIGHSYGGFMSNWLITQYPDRFAAAAVGAGISNWISDYGTADIAVTKETEFYGTPWQADSREIMLRQSPLMYANRAKAATLFIHGEVDQRVPYEEAEQMYFALKKNGVPAKIIRYDDQPHGIAGSWNIVHRMLNERRWLDTYLNPARATVP
jgi:dipeptidyl aminopeptidase/acylaminoacyl peptidase